MAAVESGPRTLISPAQLSRGHGKVVYWAVLGLLIPVFALLFPFPLYWMMTGGLKSPSEVVQTPPGLLPAHPGYHKYVTAWDDLGLGRLILNTLASRAGAADAADAVGGATRSEEQDHRERSHPGFGCSVGYCGAAA